MKTDEDFNNCLEQKISEIESKSYEFPKSFCRNDYILVGIVSVISLVAIILGGFIK